MLGWWLLCLWQCKRIRGLLCMSNIVDMRAHSRTSNLSSHIWFFELWRKSWSLKSFWWFSCGGIWYFLDFRLYLFLLWVAQVYFIVHRFCFLIRSSCLISFFIKTIIFWGHSPPAGHLIWHLKLTFHSWIKIDNFTYRGHASVRWEADKILQGFFKNIHLIVR